MRVEFTNTFLDVLRFNAAHQIRNVPIQGFYILIAAFIFFVEYSYTIDGIRQSTIVGAFSSAFLWYIALWVIQFLFNSIYLYSRKNKSVLTTHIVELQDDAFYEETPYNRSYFYWPGIVKVVNMVGYLAVYVTPHMAVIIPSRCFSSYQQREEFREKLLERIENA